MQLLSCDIQNLIIRELGVEFVGAEDEDVLIAKVDKNVAPGLTSKEKIKAAKEILKSNGIYADVKYRTIEKKVARPAIRVSEDCLQNVYLVTPSPIIDLAWACHLCYSKQAAYRFAKADIKKAIAEKMSYIHLTDRYLIIKLKPLTKNLLSWVNNHKQHNSHWCVWSGGIQCNLQGFIHDYKLEVHEIFIKDIRK